ncbi:hypothetical protein, partial [Rhodovulum sulfidophilum]|uniref:hypothetical protein n=1 Tax=Rhodovulum sulfidophilum TaxID=35806 RepID=UPI001F31BCAD
RRHRPEPPQTGKGPSRNAETAKRLTGKALALSSAADILRSQTGVFQQNRRRAVLRCVSEQTVAFLEGAGQK